MAPLTAGAVSEYNQRGQRNSPAVRSLVGALAPRSTLAAQSRHHGRAMVVLPLSRRQSSGVGTKARQVAIGGSVSAGRARGLKIPPRSLVASPGAGAPPP